MQNVQGLTRLVAALQGLNTKGGMLADRLEASAASLALEMESTTAIIDTVEATRDALRAVNQAMETGTSNGGPPGPLPGSTLSPALTLEALPAAPDAMQAVASALGVTGTMETTPIGVVFRPDGAAQ